MALFVEPTNGSDVPNGYRVRFAPAEGLLPSLAKVVEVVAAASPASCRVWHVPTLIPAEPTDSAVKHGAVESKLD